jgi:drug/metabolite transporter (DMT)-like permease
MNAAVFMFLVAMTLIGSFAAFFLKKAAGAPGIKALLKNPNFYIGGILYFLSALINIHLLRFLPYSVVLPLTSITYIWTMIIASVLLKERISAMKIIGLTLIVVGAAGLVFFA